MKEYKVETNFFPEKVDKKSDFYNPIQSRSNEQEVQKIYERILKESIPLIVEKSSQPFMI